MNRRSRPARLGIALALIALLACSGGCTKLLLTAMYVIKGNDAEAEYSGLNKKKVAVVCRAHAGLQYQDPRLGQDLARGVGDLLKENANKVKIVDQRKIEKWMDENTWDEYLEVGKAVEAEMVLAIEVDNFQLQQGQTMYQGRANLTIKVYDCKTQDVVWEKSLPTVVYPPNHCLSAQDRERNQFRREFAMVLAERVARSFYAHDPNADLGLDSRAGLGPSSPPQ